MKIKQRFKVNYKNERGYGLTDIWFNAKEIRKESNFSLVVLAGVNAMAREQRKEAPVGQARSIPPSIKAGRITKRGNKVTGLTWTNLKQAIFTNEGTGKHRAGGSEYRITGVNEKTGRKFSVMHPGIRAQHWFERGADKAKPEAYRAFSQKAGRIMRKRFR